MQSLVLSWTRFRVRLGRSPEAVALITFLVVFLFFAIGADRFLTSLSLANIATFASIMGIVVVGVALDTVGQIESHMLMRHYEGFMKSGRIKGRR